MQLQFTAPVKSAPDTSLILISPVRALTALGANWLDPSVRTLNTKMVAKETSFSLYIVILLVMRECRSVADLHRRTDGNVSGTCLPVKPPNGRIEKFPWLACGQSVKF